MGLFSFVLLFGGAACSTSKPAPSEGLVNLQRSADGGGIAGCSTGSALCGGACVYLTSSVLHCGQCGVACRQGQTCRDGQCASSQLCTGLTECRGTCVDLQTSVASCGDCMNACGYAQVCLQGVCAQPCTSETVYCDHACIEPANHSRFCGATPGCGATGGSKGEACSPQQRCVEGHCEVDCPEGQSACTVAGTVACHDVRTEREHCGRCGNACDAQSACSRGMCCPGGQEACQGQCRDTQNDVTACGGCGVACDAGQQCSGGVCGP